MNHRGTREAPRPQGGASREGDFIHIVPLDPTYKAEFTEHVPASPTGELPVAISLKKIPSNRLLDHKKTMGVIPWKKKNQKESSQASLLHRQGRSKTPHLHRPSGISQK